MPALEISHHTSPFDERVIVIVLEGQLDHLSAPVFEDYVQNVVGPGHSYLLDLASVNYVNSAGLGAVASLAKRIQALEDSGLVLIRVESRVRRTMEMVQLDQVLLFANDEEQGCAMLADGASGRED